VIFIGTAGWSIPRTVASAFPQPGTHLERYARVLNCAEINSSFYRPHAFKVYARWAASTPTDFRFAAKLPKTITHENKLIDTRKLLVEFLEQVTGLGSKLGALLVQLPPSLQFEGTVAFNFFTTFRKLYSGVAVCEPRHLTWFTDEADELLRQFQIARAAADPAIVAQAGKPGGWSIRSGTKQISRSTQYYRLHGSPRMYWSRYSISQLAGLALNAEPTEPNRDVWFIFDNTASGSAIENALEIKQLYARATELQLNNAS
jgi:uncharacterized protein YecE (DUF72 family)